MLALSTEMTWILGSGVTFGYGALVSDVRASFFDGNRRYLGHVDALQKIYPVGPWMMAGFAGSVQFGFQSIAHLQRSFGDLPPDRSHLPEPAAWRWYRHARRAFARAPEDVRAFSSSIILVGASPLRNGPFHWARCLRMRSPSFEPERIRGLVWTSIGSGSTHETALALAQQKIADYFLYAQGETGNPGGTAFSIATSVALDLTKSPIPFVSSRLQVGTVWQGRHETKTLEGAFHGPAWSSWKLVENHGLATTWNDFQAIAGKSGFRASGAVT
jgi:hypothetical protein